MATPGQPLSGLCGGHQSQGHPCSQACTSCWAVLWGTQLGQVFGAVSTQHIGAGPKLQRWWEGCVSLLAVRSTGWYLDENKHVCSNFNVVDFPQTWFYATVIFNGKWIFPYLPPAIFQVIDWGFAFVWWQDWGFMATCGDPRWNLEFPIQWSRFLFMDPFLGGSKSHCPFLMNTKYHQLGKVCAHWSWCHLARKEVGQQRFACPTTPDSSTIRIYITFEGSLGAIAEEFAVWSFQERVSHHLVEQNISSWNLSYIIHVAKYTLSIWWVHSIMPTFSFAPNPGSWKQLIWWRRTPGFFWRLHSPYGHGRPLPFHAKLIFLWL